MDLRIGLRTTTYCENLQANFQNYSYVICTGALVTRIYIYRSDTMHKVSEND